MKLFGLPVEAYQAMRGFGPVCDAIERAEWWLNPNEHLCGVIGEDHAKRAINLLDVVEEMLEEDGPRGDGARFAVASMGVDKPILMRARAQEIIARAEWERLEVSAITGGHVEERAS